MSMSVMLFLETIGFDCFVLHYAKYKITCVSDESKTVTDNNFRTRSNHL